MSYSKQTWTNNVSSIDETKMNHIEDGIYDNSVDIEELQNQFLSLEDGIHDNTVAIEELQNEISSLIVYENFVSSSLTTAANGQTTANISIAKSGYTPIGVLFLDAANNIDVMKWSITTDNILYVRIHNVSTSSLTYTINARILYLKNES